MAETQENSNLVANALASPPTLNNGAVDGRKKLFTFTQGAAAGDANSIARLFDLKAGEVLDTHQMSIRFSAFGAARTLNIGNDAYTLPNGTVVAQNPLSIAVGIAIKASTFSGLTEPPYNILILLAIFFS